MIDSVLIDSLPQLYINVTEERSRSSAVAITLGGLLFGDICVNEKMS